MIIGVVPQTLSGQVQRLEVHLNVGQVTASVPDNNCLTHKVQQVLIGDVSLGIIDTALDGEDIDRRYG